MLVMNDMSFDQRVHREASALGDAGHDVTVVCLRGGDLPASESRGSYAVIRVADATTATWKNPLGKANQARRRTAALAEAVVMLRPDVVHAHDTDTLPAASRSARMAGAKLLYDAHELFPDQFIGSAAGTIGPARLWWRAVERRLIPRVDAVITVSPGLARMLEARYGVRVTVVRNVPALMPRVKSTRLREELGVGSTKPLVLYQGLLLPERGLVSLVEAMALVPDAVLVVQGTGPEEHAMRTAAERAGLIDKVRFTGWVAPEDTYEYASGADIGVVIYEAATLNNLLAGPNKLFVYMMAGLPIAARDFPAFREIVVSEQIGDVFAHATAESIASTLNRMLAERDALARAGERARAVAESTYNWDREKHILIDAYRTLGEGGSR